jgi:arylsulfatase A-like enzyme/Flp pilus assembly protein TadD
VRPISNTVTGRFGVLASIVLLTIAVAGYVAFRPSSSTVAIQNLAPGSLEGANILLITIDTLRADRLGTYGSTARLTPTLDGLARAGIRFQNAFAQAPMTLPAHTSILTGLSPPRHGVRNNGAYRLTSIPTVTTLLKQAGYRTAAFIGAFVLDARFGLNRDFDLYDDFFGHEREGTDFDVVERTAERVVEPAADWIVSRRDGPPWFAWVHLFDPHAPYHAPPAFAQGRTPYDAEVAYADASLGHLLERLREARQLDRTLVIVTADHGESLGEHGETTHGLFAYNSTLRVPMIFWGAGIRPQTYGKAVSHLDIVPTIVSLLGLVSAPKLEGRSLVPALAGQPEEPRPLYFEALDANLTRGWAPLTGIVYERWKYIDLPDPELYDLQQDPWEIHNIASAEVKRVEAMAHALKDLAADSEQRMSSSTRPVDADTAARLRSLGYAGSPSAPRKPAYSQADDPKRLVGLNEIFNSALREYAEGQVQTALSHLRSVLAQRPDFLTARTSAATILVLSGRPADAIILLQDGIARGFVSPSAYVKLGQAYQAAGDLRQAAAALERGTAAGAEPEGLNTLGVVYAQLGRRDEARRAFERLIAIDPAAAGTWNNLGLLELNAGRPREAEAAFRQAVKTNPNYAAAWQGLGASVAARHPDQAIDAWKHAAALLPNDFDLMFNLGVLLAESPHPAEALPFLRRFAREAPRDRYARDIPRVEAAIARISRAGPVGRAIR